MRPDLKKIAALSVIAIATILSGASQDCRLKKVAKCNKDDCCRIYCLGPENTIANSPKGPITCNGNFVVTVSGLYWGTQQDGMEYAIETMVVGTDSVSGNPGLNNLIDGEYLSPNYTRDFGFQLGASYISPCDGWDIGVKWTYFRNTAKDHIEAESEDNTAILPLWSAFQYPNAGNAPILFANDIVSSWRLDLNLIDIELGRAYWTSKFLSLRPFVGLRIASIEQNFDLQHKGGSYNDPGMSLNYNDYVDLDNDFHGTGLRIGLDSNWNFGCGWALYGNLAASLVYGKFDIDHDEWVRQATGPFTKHRILEATEKFRASRAIVDLGLGIQWSTLFSDCKYGIRVALGFEQHLFYHQNQLWRVVRNGGNNGSGIINNTGENIFHQRRGNLSTEGWTLTGNFYF